MKYEEEEEEEEVNLIESRGAALIRWGFAIIQPFTNHSQLGRLQSRRHRCHHVYHPHTTRWHCHADLNPPAHYLRQGATVSIWPVHRGPPGSDKLITGTRRATGAHCCTLGWTLKCALWWTPVDTLVCTGTHRCTFARCTLEHTCSLNTDLVDAGLCALCLWTSSLHILVALAVDDTGVSNKGAVIFLNRGTSEQATSQDDLYKFFGSYSFFLDLVPNGKGFSKSGRVLNKIPGRGSGLGRVGVWNLWSGISGYLFYSWVFPGISFLVVVSKILKGSYHKKVHHPNLILDSNGVW